MSSDQTRAGLLLLEGEGGDSRINSWPGSFFLDDTRKKGRKRERKRENERVNTEKDRKKEKEIKAQAYLHHIHTRKLIFLENRKTIS